MDLSSTLFNRSSKKCELCSNDSNLSVYHVPPVGEVNAQNSILICETCLNLLDDPKKNSNHWRSLSESMWSEYSPVQVMAWRILKDLSSIDWAKDLLDQFFLDDETLKWAEATQSESNEPDNIRPTKDSNGTILLEGDSVTLIKDLEVKGANFTAKRGTLVKNISLTSNPEHIEGRVNGTHIVLLTCFLKKAI
jgi:protein PhnA